jgi:hypothetical protein
MALNGRTVGPPIDRGPVVMDTYGIFLREAFTGNNKFMKSPPAIRAGMSPYLVFSVFRI